MARRSTPTAGVVTPYNCTFVFDSTSGLSARRPAPAFGAGPIGSFLGGNGQTGREGKLLSMLPDLKRYNFNLLAHYTFSDAFEPFVEAKWNRVEHAAATMPARPSSRAAFDPVRRPRARPARQPVPDPGAAHDDRQCDPRVGLQYRPVDGLLVRWQPD